MGFFERVQGDNVEAGVAKPQNGAPYPEELFRQMTDTLAELHFAPTALARQNLLAEGVTEDSVHVTGNTVVDALLRLAGHETDIEDSVLAELLAADGSLVLLTAHRRESFGEPLRRVFRAVREIVDRRPDVQVIYPVHPNPQVLRPAREHLADHPRVHLTAPLTYPDLLRALGRANLVLTGFGGDPEEAPPSHPRFGAAAFGVAYRTPGRRGGGVAGLVGTNRERIVDDPWPRFRSCERGGDRESGFANPYGDGNAAARIADIVVHRLTGTPRRTRDWHPEAS